MAHTLVEDSLLDALKEHDCIAGQICPIATEEVRVFLNECPDVGTKLEGLDPEVLAWAIEEAIGELGILELVQPAIVRTIEGAASEPPELDPGDQMDGDTESALASAGIGTDEDYGRFSPDEGDW